MGVDVDEPGGHQLAGGFELLDATARHGPDRRDPPLVDRDVGGDGGVAEPVDDQPASDDQVVCHATHFI